MGIVGLALAAGCTTTDKGATPADTATAQSTTVAPAGASAPAIGLSPTDTAPVNTTGPANTTTKSSGGSVAVPKTTAPTTRPRSTTGTTTPKTQPVERERDSVMRPRATVDEYGNIVPIKRDTLK